MKGLLLPGAESFASVRLTKWLRLKVLPKVDEIRGWDKTSDTMRPWPHNSLPPKSTRFFVLKLWWYLPSSFSSIKKPTTSLIFKDLPVQQRCVPMPMPQIYFGHAFEVMCKRYKTWNGMLKYVQLQFSSVISLCIVYYPAFVFSPDRWTINCNRSILQLYLVFRSHYPSISPNQTHPAWYPPISASRIVEQRSRPLILSISSRTSLSSARSQRISIRSMIC